MGKPTKKIVVDEELTKASERKYPKKSILQSKAFTRIERDFLGAYLADRDYTMAEAKKVLADIKKGVVK